MLLTPTGANLVLWLHILAAAVWIGGQLLLAMLVPVLRGEPLLVSAAARRFNLVGWIAFAVLIVTGIANIHNAGIATSNLLGTQKGRTLMLKLVFVAISGLAAAIHAYVVAPRATRQRTRGTRALSGVLGGTSFLAAVLAALYGVVIAEA